MDKDVAQHLGTAYPIYTGLEARLVRDTFKCAALESAANAGEDSNFSVGFVVDGVDLSGQYGRTLIYQVEIFRTPIECVRCQCAGGVDQRQSAGASSKRGACALA